jgi:Zn ribbon nucleic-acid-binding protein
MKTATELAKCAACARDITMACWQELPLIETIEGATILQHVSVWPDDKAIEVRACRDCGRSIARTVRRA